MHPFRLALPCLAFLALGAPTLRAQTTAPAQNEFQAEQIRIQELWKAKRFEEGLALLQARVQSPAFPDLSAEARAGVHYNMACAVKPWPTWAWPWGKGSRTGPP